jgi:hypothetical protein
MLEFAGDRERADNCVVNVFDVSVEFERSP